MADAIRVSARANIGGQVMRSRSVSQLSISEDLERELTAVQFKAQNASHMIHLILDSKQSNNLFFSPIPGTGAHILDIGTGNGCWCRDVGDKFPGS